MTHSVSDAGVSSDAVLPPVSPFATTMNDIPTGRRAGPAAGRLRLLAFACLAAAMPAYASAALPAATAAAQRPLPLEQIEPIEEIALDVGEGRLVELRRKATKVLVADPRIASFQVPSPGHVFVFALRGGATTLYALDDGDKAIAAIRVVAHLNLPSLKAQLKRQMPEAADRVELEEGFSGRVIVRGKVRTPQQAREVVDFIQAYLDSLPSTIARANGQAAPPPQATRVGDDSTSSVINQLQVEASSQINIQVRVVEVSRSLSHELGFNWATLLNTGNGTWGVMTGSAASAFAPVATVPTSLFDSVTGRSFSSLIPGSTTAQLSAGGMTTRGRFTLGGLISALSAEGFATLLAEPNLTAQSGESAAFAVGGEVPIVILTNNTVQIDYKSYGVILRMTPTLLSPNRISLHVAPEVSELTEDGAVTLQGLTIPAFKVRRADTTVELASGQSFALAGMLRSSAAQTISGVPGLSRIPWLGRLFEGEKTERAETELVILVTANVVDPVHAADLQVPGQGLPHIDENLPQQAAVGYLY